MSSGELLMDASAPASLERRQPELAFESTTTRRSIMASYWVVILLALPLWWTTTSIERQSLPASRVFSQQDRELVFPVQVHLDTTNYSAVEGTTLAQEVQQCLEASPDLQEFSGLRIAVTSEQKHHGAYQVSLGRGEDHTTVEGRQALFDLHSDDEGLSTKHLAMRLADTLVTLLAPYTTLRSSQSERVVKYAPRYRLAFTLLNEDAASGNYAHSWDIRNSISKHISPVLDKLSVLHNFTIESQVQMHGPLAFEPRALEAGGREMYGLTQEDLTVFVNSAEWTLSSSVSNDPVLHFVLFIPSSHHNPLHILNEGGHPTASNAFLLPQWGGIVLFNPPLVDTTHSLASPALDSVFTTFRHQLMTLLGVPALPANIRLGNSRTDLAAFTDWQRDALLRRRAAENVVSAQETLQSIVRLVAQIENMPVGQDVKNDVQNALSALDKAYAAASSSSEWSLYHAADALMLASRAFFNPGMLALLYFPAEHKYAVYAPLFASIAMPLLAPVLREILAWRKARKAAVQGDKKVDPVARPKVE